VKLYLGNKMSGIPYFNAPWFDTAAAFLMTLPHVDEVFNPAQHDRDMGFDPMQCPNGSPEEAKAAGFEVHKALKADWSWIADHSDGLIVGPDWYNSPGTMSEVACHQALRLPVVEYMAYMSAWDDPELLSEVTLPWLIDTPGCKTVRPMPMGSPWRPWDRV
jgi:hypothetical protein